MDGEDPGTMFLRELEKRLEKLKGEAEAAIAQVPDDELFRPLGADENSIAVIMRHMAGNMRSRFTDFLTTDGEKPTRHRDAEFEEPPRDRTALLADWDSGWSAMRATVAALTPLDLGRTVHIRSEEMTATTALVRALAHLAAHQGQLVLLAKHFAGARWTTLSIPRGQSETFAASLRARRGP